MAETVEGIVTEAGVDVSGLDRGLTESIALLQRFAQQVGTLNTSLPPLDIDTDLIIQKLQAAGGDVGSFFSGLRQGVREGLVEVQAEIAARQVDLSAVIPPPDFTDFIAETVQASDLVRREFLDAFPVQALGIEAKQAAALAADELQTGLLTRLGTLRDEIATGIIDPAQFRQQADVALEAFSQEIAQRQAEIPALVVRVRQAGPTDSGVITEADFARVQAFDQVAQAEQRVTRATTEGEKAFGAHGRAALAARSSLTVLAAQALGTSSTLGRLAESALLFGGGSAAVIAVAGAVLVGVKAFEAITAQSRAAKEEIDGAIASLLKLQEAQRSPVRAATDQAGLAAARVDALRTQIEKLLATQRDLESHPLVFSDRGGDQTFARLTLINGQLVELGHKFAEAAQAASTGGLVVATKQAEELAAAIRLGTAGIADFAAAAAQIAHFNDLAADGTKDLSVQNEARQKANALIDATQGPLTRQLELQQRITTESVAATGAADALTKAQAQVAAGEDFSRLIVSYKALAVAAAGDVEQVQRLADKRLELEKLRQSSDAAIVALAHLGATTAPTLKFPVQFDFVSPMLALANTITNDFSGAADLLIGDFTTKLLLQLESRSRASVFSKIIEDLRRPITEIEPDNSATSAAERGVEDLNKQLLRTNESWVEATQAAERHEQAIEANLTSIGRFNQKMSEAVQLANGLGTIASAFGDIGQAAQQGLQGVNQLFDSVTAFAEGDVLGGIVSGVAGLANLGQALFGESPLQRERNAILERNTAALEHLTTVADRQEHAITGGQVADAVAAAAALQERVIGPKRTNFSDAAQFTREVQSAFERSGLDITDIETIAKSHGIELLDPKGNVIPEAIKQFNQAILDGTIPINELAQAAENATGALINLPDVFKVEAARAFVQRAEPNPLTITGPGPGTTNTSVSATPATVSTTGTVVQTTIGSVTIVVTAAKDPAATAEAVRQEFEREAMRNSGNPDGWRPGPNGFGP